MAPQKAKCRPKSEPRSRSDMPCTAPLPLPFGENDHLNLSTGRDNHSHIDATSMGVSYAYSQMHYQGPCVLAAHYTLTRVADGEIPKCESPFRNFRTRKT
eukprot:6185312-Pleurochrysis_carterae.AAC.2